jgi:hypothetical protein
VNIDQCNSGIAGVITNCFWLYSASSGTAGSCSNKINSSLECTLVPNVTQCESGLEGTSLANTCGIYDGSCKKKCSELESSSCGTGDRVNDCGIYGDVCKDKCSTFSNENCGKDVRSNDCAIYGSSCNDKCSIFSDSDSCRSGDCFWLKGSTSPPSGDTCVNTV